jgi:hypothetical protein
VRFFNLPAAQPNPNDCVWIVEYESVKNEEVLELAIVRLAHAECDLVWSNVQRKPTTALCFGEQA